MTGAAGPGTAGTAAGSPCTSDGCDGVVEADGFCDTCGHAASPPPVVSRTAPALPLPRAAPEATGRHAAPTAATGANNGTPTAPPTARPTASPTAPPTAPPTAARHGDPTVMPTGSQHGVPTGPPSGPSSTTAGGRWSGPLSTGPTGSSRLRRAGATDDIPPVPRVNPSSALLRDPQVPERDRYCRHGGKPHAVGRSREGRPGLVRGHCPQDGTPYSFAPPLSEGALVAGQYEVRGALAHGGLGWIYLAVDRNVDDRWVVLKGVLDANDPAALAAARAERQFLAQLNHPNIVAIHNFVRHVDAGVAADYIVMAYIGGSTLSQVRDARAGNGALPVAHALAYMIKVLPALGYLHAEGHVYSDFKPDNVMQCERHLTLIDMGAVARIDDADAVVYGTVGYHAPEVVRAELSPASDLYTVGRTLAVLALGIEAAQDGVATELPGDHPLLLRHESLHRLLLRATHPDPRYRFGSADEMAEQLDGVRREVLAVDEQRPRPGQSAVFSAPRGTFAASLLIGRSGPERPVAARVADLLPIPLDAADADPDDWSHGWSAAVTALATGDLDTARAAFDALYSTFPGELAPKLALAAAAECAGDDEGAQHYYALVATVDPSWADAAFGLARTRLRAGQRAAAVAALHAVPTSSSAYIAAQRAAVEATLLRHDTGAADDDELRAAASLLERLDLDPLTTQRMRVAVLEAAVDRVDASTGPGAPVLGCAWEGRALRLELEGSLRRLAKLTPDRAEKITLVDRANSAHPRTLR
jgi:serine/threonine-protein kinase PknG